MSKSLFRGLGLSYAVIGFLLLWYYLFTLTPFVEARREYEEFNLKGRELLNLRQATRPFWTPTSVDSPAVAAATKLIAPLFPNLQLAKLGELSEQKTDLELLEQRAQESYERDKQQRVVPATTTTTSPVTPNVPPRYVFRIWLVDGHESLADSWFIDDLTSLKTQDLCLRCFLALGLALGLVFGGVKLMHLSRAEDAGVRDWKYVVLPFGTPVLTLIVVLLLTGFGPVFAGPLDPATSRLLIIITVVVALGPEEFLLALSEYVRSVGHNRLVGVLGVSTDRKDS